MTAAALAAVERVVARGGDADAVLREVVSILHARLGRFVRISFLEQERLVPGPAEGEVTVTTAIPISFQERPVAELEAGGELSADERALLSQVAALLAPYALVGWDTGGEDWTP